MKKIVLITVIIALAFALTGCKHEDDGPKNQSATISLSFDQTYTATVKGNLTDEEWKGVAGKIETAINTRYKYFEEIDSSTGIERFETVFGRGVTIIVEKTPSGYTKWKTIDDGKTMWLSYGELDDTPQTVFHSMVNRLYTNTADFVKASARDAVRLSNGNTKVPVTSDRQG